MCVSIQTMLNLVCIVQCVCLPPDTMVKHITIGVGVRSWKPILTLGDSLKVTWTCASLLFTSVLSM